MSILINIYYKGENGSPKAFAREMLESGIVQNIRREDGNLRYDYFLPYGDENTLLLIDEWRDQKALDIHHASPMMQKIITLREKYSLTMRVERYVGDENGIPKNDKKYIKE